MNDLTNKEFKELLIKKVARLNKKIKYIKEELKYLIGEVEYSNDAIKNLE